MAQQEDLVSKRILCQAWQLGIIGTHKKSKSYHTSLSDKKSMKVEIKK